MSNTIDNYINGQYPLPPSAQAMCATISQMEIQMSIDAISWAFAQDVKPAARKFVLIALADSADDHGICWPSYKHIMKKTSLSRRSVIDNMTALVSTGYLKKSSRTRANNSDTSNAYLIEMGQGKIDDHPLSGLFSRGAGDAPPPVQEMHPPVQEMHPPRAGDAPLEPSLEPSFNQREREPLTRDDFLNDINTAFHAGEFKGEFEHLSETEIMLQGSECHRAWGDDLRGREPHVILRSWIRKGINLGMIPKAPKKASQRVMPEINAVDLQPWQADAVNRKIFSDAEMIAWIAKLEYDGNKTLYAPTRFHAQQVEKRFMKQLQRAVHSQVQIIVRETVS